MNTHITTQRRNLYGHLSNGEKDSRTDDGKSYYGRSGGLQRTEENGCCGNYLGRLEARTRKTRLACWKKYS